MSIRVIHREPAPEPDEPPAVGDPYDWRPTWADLDAQNRVLHREVGELHLVVARALDGKAEALLREAAARRGQVEAEAAVARVRAWVARNAPACVCAGTRLMGHDDVCPQALLVALDGAPAASGG